MFNCDVDQSGETTFSEFFNCGSTLADNFTGNFDYATGDFGKGISATADLGNSPKSVQ